MPPFRAEHIGSLLRPAALLELRKGFAAGRVDAAALRAGEDMAIREAVALQERVGLKLATDGEFRRRSYHSYFFAQLGDIEPDWTPPDSSDSALTPRRAVQPAARIRSRLEWKHPIHVDDFNFLKSAKIGRAHV